MYAVPELYRAGQLAPGGGTTVRAQYAHQPRAYRTYRGRGTTDAVLGGDNQRAVADRRVPLLGR
eukprot:scaffold74228_cov35-Phaeocystis_antarctica.AAC.2